MGILYINALTWVMHTMILREVTEDYIQKFNWEGALGKKIWNGVFEDSTEEKQNPKVGETTNKTKKTKDTCARYIL